MIFSLTTFTATSFFFIHPFLAITNRYTTKILIVEGWVHDYAIHDAVNEFKRGQYQRVLTTGGPVTGTGKYSNDYNTSASIGAGRLKAAGLSAEFVQMVPSRVNLKDRTYSSALALKEWFHRNQIHPQAINVLTEDAHARRTRLLFQKAFGDDVKVGIIAIANPDYDSKHWWRYSEGVREVLGESIAYIYARFFFHPSQAENEN